MARAKTKAGRAAQRATYRAKHPSTIKQSAKLRLRERAAKKRKG